MNQSRIEYVLFHLGLVFEIKELRKYFHFGEKKEIKETGIYFPLSREEADWEKVIRIDQHIPLLFPLGNKERYYREEEESIIFEHDLLRSAFYLLSGQQEWQETYQKPLNQYSWHNSIQKKLGITEKPVVNYYFEIIGDGLKRFCEINGLDFERKGLFEQPLLFMSHDVDRVRCYAIDRFKLFLKKLKLKKLGKYIINRLFKLPDPWWNFDYFIDQGKKYGVKSTWFFLGKGTKRLDAKYRFEDKKVTNLMENLTANGHEIGVHGTIHSAFEPEKLKAIVNNINLVYKEAVLGTRQHYLNYYPGITAELQIEAGLKYDCSLGFRDRVGFRNSFCLPFKMYDFNKEKPHDIWEIPLLMMDRSAFEHMQLKTAEVKLLIIEIIKELKKFNGVFGLLVHNNFIGAMDKGLRKERESFYEDMLAIFKDKGLNSHTGTEILNLIDRKQ